VFLVKGLERIIEDMFAIEKYSSELRTFYITQQEIKANFARIALRVIDNALNYKTADQMMSGCREVSSLRNLHLWNALLPEIRVEIDLLITQICTAASTGNWREYQHNLIALKDILKDWEKQA
jgi:hypothetical protein